ncbi:CPBP family intramembrane metalloprotease [Desertihabitans brevis]|uniref:CPBP family intramembrane metalloprotease n=1 Tax=Desertihabitans brevis TaxID=2268447 RepID=A0A367YT33_9ACTN|nr:CPBP family intramembrane glutamic endopeptidase [Desertihabitans brevis]RCK68192.1 CPBP family intramembrane metalloprotease [Desertihabitans brevis]
MDGPAATTPEPADPPSGTTATEEQPAPPPRWSVKLVPAALLLTSAFFLFAYQVWWIGYPLLVAALVLAVLLDRGLAKDLLLIALGIGIVSWTSVEADVGWSSFIRIGATLALAVSVPLLVDRLVFRRKAYTFPWRSRQKKTRGEIAYLFAVPFLGWAILPFYFIRSGAYENWPQIVDTSELVRFFIGVNAVGTWDELFFICTVFALLRRHFPIWQANLLQTAIFVSFLWELGYREWGPLLTIPFALLQGYLFSKTRSLGYVLIVHLLFDAIVFLAIVHAHNRDWWPIFLY